MPDDAPHFDDRGRLIAPKYDDVYFSAEDGLAETRHVFLQGNHLTERFSAMKPGERFTIGESGFGTGLNFLAAWQLFEQHAPPNAQLDFVSVEGFPLDQQMMVRALSPWPELRRYREALLQQWGPIWPGRHRFRFTDGRLRLTLLVGEAAQALASIEARVDAWFLDGFAPSRNPEMWSEAVFSELARLSVSDATLATYTAAGFVRRGLDVAGFDIVNSAGFGTKRDMTVGVCRSKGDDKKWGGHSCLPSAEGRSAIVIGGSLAGAFAARSLAERGIAVRVIEQQLSISNSAFPPSLIPRRSVLQPKINDEADLAGQFLREGYAFAQRLLESNSEISNESDWRPCGTFQAAHDERSSRRLRRFVDQFSDSGLCRWIDAEQSEAETGIRLPFGGVVIDGAGTLRPAGLCSALLDHPQIEVNSHVQALSIESLNGSWRLQCSGKTHRDTKLLIVANAMDAVRLLPEGRVDLRPIRGQVTSLWSDNEVGVFGLLRMPIFYGGYLIPSGTGGLSLGASFVPGDDSIDWRDSDHLACCEQLARVLPSEAERLKQIKTPEGWAGVRTTTANHRCYMEQVDDGLYVSLGHGSHGISSAAHAAEHLACLITDGPRARQL
ncbi:MAG: tRNA (5-methylaminomethyl-2-thiouridine)(34)-methyltransferase MnmD [Planctomycetota bacterium]